MTALERFLRYVTFETPSDGNSGTWPSGEGERVFAEALAEEMKTMGLSGVRVDENGYVYAFIPEKDMPEAPAIGFIAHMDTVDCVPVGPMAARVIRYEGGDITLANGDVLDTATFPFLKELEGHDLVVTDGRTLLGGDDKAGVAAILTMCERLLAPDAPAHGRVCVAFTPDEEIGQGADRFDVAGFGAKFAYTVDGGAANEVEFENFNAATGRVHISGKSIHPGSAKDRMVNALRVAMRFDALLPEQQRPEYTEGYDGFFHLSEMKGAEDAADMIYILRDHDAAKLALKKKRFEAAARFLNAYYGEGTVEVSLRDTYFNMREKIERHRDVLDRAHRAMAKNGLTPRVQPIRGGTDGARLSFMGLPCPNLGTGDYNAHGRHELVDVQGMEKVVDVLFAIATERT